MNYISDQIIAIDCQRRCNLHVLKLEKPNQTLLFEAVLSSPQVYIHGPSEVPDVATKNMYSEKDFYLKLYVTAVAIYTTSDAAE